MNEEFELWWNENKDNDSLLEEYEAYKQDCIEIQTDPMCFKDWCIEFYDEII